MSAARLAFRIPRRSFHVSSVFRSSEEAAAQRKYLIFISKTKFDILTCWLGAERTMTRFWKRAGIKEANGNSWTVI